MIMIDPVINHPWSNAPCGGSQSAGGWNQWGILPNGRVAKFWQSWGGLLFWGWKPDAHPATRPESPWPIQAGRTWKGRSEPRFRTA
jgi:hypothetical protein